MDIAVAAVRQSDIVTVYFCGGDGNYDTATRWFHSLQVNDGVIDGESSGWQLHAEVDGNDMTGSVRDDNGMDHAWSVSPTTDGSLAGLYTASTDGCTTGVIVWESGTDESTGEPTYEGQGTWCNMASEFEQVIILEPILITTDGLPVSVERPGFEEFYVTAF
jgi:hypothetical protein